MDRMTKILLALLAAALWGGLLRPLMPLPAQAQPKTPTVSTTSALAMAADGGTVYIINGHTLSAWQLDGPVVKNQFGMMVPGPKTHLHLLDTKSVP